MVIIHGTRLRRVQGGRVADYCPECDGVTAQKLFHEERYHHVYFVPMGRAKIVGVFRECEGCGRIMYADPLGYAGTLPPDADAGVDDLVEHTNPAAHEQARAIRSIPERRAAGELTDDDRVTLASDVLVRYNREYTQRSSDNRMDKRMVLVALVPMAILVVPVCSMIVKGGVGTTWEPLAMLAGLLALLAALPILRRGGAWWLKGQYPSMAAELREAGCTPEVLDQTWEQLWRMGMPIAKAADLRRIRALLQGSQT